MISRKKKANEKAAIKQGPENAGKLRKSRKPRAPGRGALFTVISLFLLSGIVRLGGETGLAIAREVSAMTEEPNQTSQMNGQMCQPADGIPELLEDLKTRRERIEQREANIADRMQALTVAQATYEANIARLIAVETSLSATMTRAETAAEDDLSRLTDVYENMKPKDAAALFETMDEEFAAGFLGRMRPDAAAAVFAGLEPETAYSISIYLAGRNANAPRE